MTREDCSEIGEDGLYHPTTEDEIICLVKKAYDEGLQIRVRGAAHSVAWSIYTDPGPGDPPIANTVSVQEPPQGPNINIIFDSFKKLEWIDEEHGIVEAEAGIHLGADPDDPSGPSSLEESLLYQTFQKGWGVNDLGGITHQTISGFVTSGSAGGSLTYDLDNIIAFRVIDGTGDVRWIEKGDDIFDAMSLSLGLLGIITKVRLQLNKTFNIYGQEYTTPTHLDACPIDLFGSGTDDKPSLKQFLEQTPYTRILWWPQRKVERIVTWQAVRGAPATTGGRASVQVFNPVPYEEFSEDFFGQAEQLTGAVFFTLLGNKGFFTTWGKLGRDFTQFHTNLRQIWQAKFGKFLGSALATGMFRFVFFFVVLFFSLFKSLLLALYPTIVNLFQPMSKKGKPNTTFQDYYWRSLPMDNTADDVLMGTAFTEIWIPLKYTERSMNLLRDEVFSKKGFTGTGYFSTELYAGYPSHSWLSPAYVDDTFTEEGTFRIDVFYYVNNDGSPNLAGGFYQQFWDVFRDNNIPFRLHWCKFVPGYSFKEWAEYYDKQLPKLKDFLRLRAERDPRSIFFTDYWKLRLTGET